jgi:ClpP class serine protease
MGDFLNIIYILVLIQIFIPLLQRRMLLARRLMAIRSLEQKRDSRVITLIHRQETMALLGFPVARYIDIEDSEQVLRAIRMTPPEMPLDLVLHTPGGLVLAADQIVMDPDAVLGPVDPQLGSQQGGYYPAASILRALEQPNPNRDDQTLILGDIARKAINQVHGTVKYLLLEHQSEQKAEELARLFSGGQWTHDYPVTFEQARTLGLPVADAMPVEIYALMDLYPQAAQRRPSVEFVPAPYRAPTRTPGKSEP